MTEQRAYQKFKTRIDSQSDREKILKTIEQYYILANDPCYNSEMEHQIMTGTDEQLKSFCLELCGEAINRDMIKYITTGTRGNIGSQLYQLLR